MTKPMKINKYPDLIREINGLSGDDFVFLTSLKSFKKWIKALPNDDERDKAINVIHEILVINDDELISESFELVDSLASKCAKDADTILNELTKISKAHEKLLELETVPPEIKDLLKKQRLDLEIKSRRYMDFLARTPSHYRSYKGWRIYATIIKKWFDAANHDFTAPLELTTTDFHQIIKRRFGDIVTIYSVCSFLRSYKMP